MHGHLWHLHLLLCEAGVGEEFHVKVGKVMDILAERNIRHRKLSRQEVDEYLHRFMAFQFKKGPFSMRNFKSTDEYLNMGDRIVKSVNLVDVDVINLPTFVRPYLSTSVNGYHIATDLFAEIFFVVNRHDKRYGTKKELALWAKTDDKLGQYGYVTPKVEVKADMQRYNTMEVMKSQLPVVMPTFDFICKHIFKEEQS